MPEELLPDPSMAVAFRAGRPTYHVYAIIYTYIKINGQDIPTKMPMQIRPKQGKETHYHACIVSLKEYLRAPSERVLPIPKDP